MVARYSNCVKPSVAMAKHIRIFRDKKKKKLKNITENPIFTNISLSF